MANVMLLATTGYLPLAASGFEPVSGTGVSLGWAWPVRWTAILPPSPGTRALCDELRRVDPASLDPAGPFVDRSYSELGDEATSVFALLTNRDPNRFDDLYAALPEHVRTTVTALSPVHAATGLRAPVEIVTAPRDRYFPVAESRALVAATPRARLTVTSLLAHATPRLDPRYLAELGRLDGFFVRALLAAR